MSELTEKDFKILDSISLDEQSNQRTISRFSGLSLGLVNILLKRLIMKGYVKVRKINKKRLFYHLTPKALEEKSRVTYKYVRRMIHDLADLKEKISTVILKEYQKGVRHFNIIGQTELADITHIIMLGLIRHYQDMDFQQADKPVQSGINIICEDLKESGPENNLDLLKKIIA